MKFVNFINNNTIMDNFFLAVAKLLLILIPLCVGLFTYGYLDIDFCKALILYSAPLSFDMGIRIWKSYENNNKDGLLFIVIITIFLLSVLLFFVGMVGTLNNLVLTEKCDFFIDNKWLVFAGILSQGIWYSIESIAFLIVIVLKKYTKKTALKITIEGQNEYNI